MSLLKSLREETRFQFDEFLEKSFKEDGMPIKYFYWEKEYILRVSELSYNVIFFSHAFYYKGLKAFSKQYLSTLVEDDDVLNGMEIRLKEREVDVYKSGELFKESGEKFNKKTYDYLKEFLLWKLLQSFNEKALEEKMKIPSEIIAQQKHNFLFIYLEFILSMSNSQPPITLSKLYRKYTSLKQYEKLLENLDNIDQQEDDKVNEEIRSKIKKLYILEKHSSKIEFVFSLFQAPANEELREILSLMQESSLRSDKQVLYRGQANSRWMLNSSLTRNKHFSDNERELYYEILSLKPEEFHQGSTVYERLITMQHYGMPTRLMDLTRNPLIALFFACNNKPLSQEDGMVYVFTPQKDEIQNFEDNLLNDIGTLYTNSNTPDSLESLYYIRGLANNQRINSQSGEFIFVGKVEDPSAQLDEKVEKFIIIDSSVKAGILDLLKDLNIHGGSVYPDLAHMSNYIKDKYNR